MKMINRSTHNFKQWMDCLKDIAIDEYNFELGYSFDEGEFYNYFDQGMDVHEAITNHQESDAV